MADKKSFVMYDNWSRLICDMPDEQAGKLIKAICGYKLGESDNTGDPVLDAVFNMIREKLDEDSAHYDVVCQKRAEARQGKTKEMKTIDNNSKQLILIDNKTQQYGSDTDTDNDTDTDINNIYSVGETRLDAPKTKKDDQNEKDIQAIVDYLNEKTQSKYSAKTNETRKSITARLKDGYTVDDFKAVIDSKVKEWFNDADMRKYLRPSTLFRPSNFESYLNEANRPAVKSKNQFNNFEQNKYNFDEMEAQLICN